LPFERLYSGAKIKKNKEEVTKEKSPLDIWIEICKNSRKCWQKTLEVGGVPVLFFWEFNNPTFFLLEESHSGPSPQDPFPSFLKKGHKGFVVHKGRTPSVGALRRPSVHHRAARFLADKGIILKDSGALEQVVRSADRLPRRCLAFLEKVSLLREPLSTSLARELAEDNQEVKYTL
jgi:hypothetical protein